MTRELLYTGFITLDGIVDSPGSTSEGHPSGGWVFDTPFLAEAFAIKGEEIAETSALLFGRQSYELFAPVWRDSEDHAAFKDFPKFVVSTTLQEDELVEGWGETRILRSLDDVARLKEEPGGTIVVHGSAELARGLSDADLIDRYNLLLFPFMLGSGKSIFSHEHIKNQRLTLLSTEGYGNGVVKLSYRVDR